MQKIRTWIVVFLLLFSVFFVPKTQVYAAEREVYVGGMPAGFLMRLDGVQVVGFSGVVSQDGSVSPSEEAGLKIGDVIVSFDGEKVNSSDDLEHALAASDGGAAIVSCRRGKERFSTQICPVKERASGTYKIGVLIRDTVSGIGTVTCVDKESGRFGALGHAVLGEDGELLQVANGKMYPCSIVNVNRGERGKAGELKGIFFNMTSLGTTDSSGKTGIFGSFDMDIAQKMPLAKTTSLNDAKPGKAEIYTTVDGILPQKYSINIVKVDKSNKENKNFVIKITDDRLLEVSGGIVQGMSGSPILQNGKLIGAVTHVFLNDPTRGYGIGIEQMFAS